MRSRPTVLLATCAEVPDLDDDDRPLVAALAIRGVEARPAIWDDPGVSWGDADLVVLRSTWDYTDRVDQFTAWARSVPRLANPAPVVAWNVDKRYLDDVAAAGVPTVPTVFVAPGDPLPELPAGDLVVKPTVAAGARGARRLSTPAAAAQHVGAVHASGSTAMVQPYMGAVDDAGETAVVFLDGELSHGARKGALLQQDAPVVAGLYAPETMAARRPTAVELDLARRALAAVPGAEPPLYARVDLVPGSGGHPVVLEVEVTEPSLFLELGDAVDRFADAIAGRL